MRPQTSLDLNPGLRTRQTSTQSTVWSGVWCRNAFIYQSPIQDVDDLKQRLISVWAEFKQRVIDKAIDQWWPRLRACVRARGQHFEQLINWSNCLSVGFVFTRTFFVRTSNLKANIHVVPFQFVKNSYFKILQGSVTSVATLCRWSWKILSHFVANLSKTHNINFYQNRSTTIPRCPGWQWYAIAFHYL